MSTVRVRETSCVNCGKTLDAVSDTGHGQAPEPGHPILCLKCGAVYILGEDLVPRAFTKQEEEELLKDEQTMNEIAFFTRKIHIMRHMQG